MARPTRQPVRSLTDDLGSRHPVLPHRQRPEIRPPVIAETIGARWLPTSFSKKGTRKVLLRRLEPVRPLPSPIRQKRLLATDIGQHTGRARGVLIALNPIACEDGLYGVLEIHASRRPPAGDQSVLVLVIHLRPAAMPVFERIDLGVGLGRLPLEVMNMDIGVEQDAVSPRDQASAEIRLLREQKDVLVKEALLAEGIHFEQQRRTDHPLATDGTTLQMIPGHHGRREQAAPVSLPVRKVEHGLNAGHSRLQIGIEQEGIGRVYLGQRTVGRAAIAQIALHAHDLHLREAGREGVGTAIRTGIVDHDHREAAGSQQLALAGHQRLRAVEGNDNDGHHENGAFSPSRIRGKIPFKFAIL